MTKHARKSPRLQAVERPTAATVQIPLPVLGAFASIERSYFDLCIRAGQQVLDAMMEQDRPELCGPRWKRDPNRRAGRARKRSPRPSARCSAHSRRSSDVSSINDATFWATSRSICTRM